MSAEELPAADPVPTDRQGADLRRSRLRLQGRTRDGGRLLLSNDEGVEFTLDVDAPLRRALQGDPHRTGKGETTMESTLRPRDIQARIRAGETPDAVAEAAHTTVEKIMAFAGPVLAEREHVAGRAQKSSVRRRAGESGGARTLGEAVATHLRSVNVDPGTVTWDSWRREDGRWMLTGEFDTTPLSGVAELTFDLPGNFVVLENDEARWLVGDLELDTDPTVPATADDLGTARERRLAAVPEEQLTIDDELEDELGVDAVELVSESGPADDPTPEETTLDLSGALPVDEPAEQPAEDQPAGEPSRTEPPARRPVRKSKGRASVPSWDEIMFGGGDQDEPR